MKRTVLLLTMLLAMSLSCPSGDGMKQYLGLKGPEPALGGPRIWTRGEKIYMLGKYQKGKAEDECTIAVFAFDGKHWNPVGKNGLSIPGTNNKSPFDVNLDAKGQPWILAYGPETPVARRSERYFLYTLKNKEWTLAGPQKGVRLPAEGGGLCFINGQTPVLLCGEYDRASGAEFLRVHSLQGEEWKPAKLDRVYRNVGTISRDGLYIYTYVKKQVAIHAVKSIDTKKLPKPFYAEELEDGVNLAGIYVRNPRTLAFLLYEGKTAKIRLIEAVKGKFVIRDIRPPDAGLVEEVSWTPKGVLCVLTTNLTDAGVHQATVYCLRGKDKWESMAQQIDPTEADIFEPILIFGPDGRPIVVWEAFFPA